MRLTVYCDGSVMVTVPVGVREGLIESFIRDRENWIIKKTDFFKQFQGHVLSRYKNRDYLKYKEKALALVEKRIGYFNQIYGYDFDRISIRNQKTRWGSCSRKGNLNFNYKIAVLPPRIADYIIVHEICHLGEFNHSKNFWKLVEQALPDYKEIRKDLKIHNFLPIS